ncbi:trihelix transcription factor ASIL2-like [Neltuma alba]|uniref:trihelix transcription factor ASIL2-like n=1 Tax=Neltuma alba TaxID=207710 RepID=UPI0010A2E9A0|nr:trihelix transcription factor ASIL2-like [Prosopis alba]XP_028804694.1 trihelix transcription factor ASIL2-like [Prosopis alba]
MASPPSSPVDSSTTTPPADPPTAVPLSVAVPPALPSSQPSSSSRRLPPPCWSAEETVALIEAYRDKWYSLGRGNLKATHWQDVADAVTSRCPGASPPKTAVQCRHKMEKLRKRYRTEIQRARNMPVARFNSSWVHFKRMDSMEKGPSPVKPENDSDDSPDEFDGDEDNDLYEEFRSGSGSNTRSLNKLYRNGMSGGGSTVNGSGGFRIRIPDGVSIAQPGNSKLYGKISDQKYNYNNNNPGSKSGHGFNNPNYETRVLKERSGLGKRERERERDPVSEMVCAIKVLGDGFVKMEQMKMEMAREIESMRMEMEMKRTEMILESQQRIVEAFAKAVSEKKTKRMPSSPSES